MQRVWRFFLGLQGKVLMIVASTVLVVIVAMAGSGWWMQRQKLLQEGLESARILSDSVYASIKHPMAIGDEEALEQQMAELGQKLQDLDVYIYDFAGKVTYATQQNQLRSDLRSLGISSGVVSRIEEGLSGKGTKQTTALEETPSGPKIAVVTPIRNEPSCHHCHGSSRKVLGGVLIRRDASPLFAYLAKLRTLSAAGTILGAFVLSAILVFILSRFVTRPLKRIVEGIGQLAEGDLTVELDHKSQDELGVLADSVNQLSKSFRDTIQQARETAFRVSEGTSQQAASIEETSASLEEITSMIRQGAEKCAEADTMMRDNDSKLNEANKVMKACITSLDQIVSTTETMAKIVKDIDEIAFQTNLLALNAAVEAARAGEAGQGFAVVADEVRSLARRASEAAKSTAELIRTAQDKTHEGRSLVQETDEAYREVAVQARKVSQLIQDVASSSQEQSLGVEQISRAAHELDQVIQSFASVTDQLTQVMDFFQTDGHKESTSEAAALLPPHSP
ncbi:methyl-accepting chemotaxis sensory transducer with TarH sensor [Desulfacinum hydrothermale DSM 13146]|uniref:Methyl-accepting chemotaxis sensory transducer with TarH sensor n=1 Tax=Desulfacinum hydrothermale DSM 13146 TaxID=1121390 RepID=A0A1W1XUF1_9BACT|nr:methyl-accepting chemotaxis protein [Desulfacinum hydrothermale]SMC27138.1 methyl-accepting chemotaxis sensory transducer with TarH sensor [Desulfacinum hydrothermale DSM 13146]